MRQYSLVVNNPAHSFLWQHTFAEKWLSIAKDFSSQTVTEVTTVYFNPQVLITKISLPFQASHTVKAPTVSTTQVMTDRRSKDSYFNSLLHF